MQTETTINEGRVIASPRFAWDDYQGDAPRNSVRWATSDRGWCFFTRDTHPDAGGRHFEYHAQTNGLLCCGNYLDYGPGSPGCSRGPNGETVHACAYAHRLDSSSTIRLGHAWFATVDEAKRFIEGNVRAYLGLPRA